MAREAEHRNTRIVPDRWAGRGGNTRQVPRKKATANDGIATQANLGRYFTYLPKLRILVYRVATLPLPNPITLLSRPAIASSLWPYGLPTPEAP